MPDAAPEMMATLPASLIALLPLVPSGGLPRSCSVHRNGANHRAFPEPPKSTRSNARSLIRGYVVGNLKDRRYGVLARNRCAGERLFMPHSGHCLGPAHAAHRGKAALDRHGG